MRFALVLVLGACVGSSGTAPNWPKQHEHDTDGGESLAPHVAAAQAIAAASTEEVKPAEAAIVTPVAVPATTTPATTTPVVTPEEPIQTEEIIIEIDD